jgi:hypothetical protein
MTRKKFITAAVLWLLPAIVFAASTSYEPGVMDYRGRRQSRLAVQTRTDDGATKGGINFAP